MMDMWQMMNQMMGPWGLGMSWFNFLSGIAFLALAIVGGVAGVSWLVGQESRGRTGGTALDILKQRYARGDLTKEEFEVVKRDIA